MCKEKQMNITKATATQNPLRAARLQRIETKLKEKAAVSRIYQQKSEQFAPILEHPLSPLSKIIQVSEFLELAENYILKTRKQLENLATIRPAAQ